MQYGGVWGITCNLRTLIVFPVSGMAREVFGKGAGVLAAWLIAFMPGHVAIPHLL